MHIYVYISLQIKTAQARGDLRCPASHRNTQRKQQQQVLCF